MINNVIDFNKYRKPDDVNPHSIIDEMVINFMKDTIQNVQTVDINPEDPDIADNVVALAMLFRAMVEREYGIDNHLQGMLDIMTEELSKNKPRDNNDE